MQENTERQFNELRNKINEQNEYFYKDIETFKKTNENPGHEELSKRERMN